MVRCSQLFRKLWDTPNLWNRKSSGIGRTEKCSKNKTKQNQSTRQLFAESSTKMTIYVKKVMTSQIRTALGVFNTTAAISLSIGHLYLLNLTASYSLPCITIFPNTNLELLAHYLYCMHCGWVLRVIFSGTFIVCELLLKHVYNSQHVKHHNIRQRYMITMEWINRLMD